MIFFHNPNEQNGYLSNWYPCKFTCDGIEYSSMEQYMMHQKAVLFNDKLIAWHILSTDDVADIKFLGRKVAKFNEQVWNKHKEQIICKGLECKFTQNPTLLKQLLKTGEQELAECAVKDRIWGIGLSMRDPDRFDKSKWQGQNLLGKCLMVVRDRLR